MVPALSILLFALQLAVLAGQPALAFPLWGRRGGQRTEIAAQRRLQQAANKGSVEKSRGNFTFDHYDLPFMDNSLHVKVWPCSHDLKSVSSCVCLPLPH